MMAYHVCEMSCMCLLAHQASLWADTKSSGYMHEQLSGCSHTCSSAVGDHRELHDHPCTSNEVLTLHILHANDM